MKDYRDANFSTGDRDPFADLVRAVEGSSVRAAEPQTPRAAAPRGRGGRPVDPEMQEALMNLSQPARPRDRAPAETQSFAPARAVEPEPAAPVRQPLPDSRQTLTLDDFDDLIASEWAAMQPAGQQPYYDDEYDAGYEDEDDYYEQRQPVRRSRLRRPMIVVGAMAASVVVAVAGTMLYTSVGSLAPGGDEPILIAADTEPYKIAPADPGGRSIPNQSKAVYAQVAAGNARVEAPTQQQLVTAMEEPIDIAETESDMSSGLPGVMVGENVALPGEEGLGASEPEPVEVASNETTLQPRRVRTLTVRPDGTLAPATEAPTIAGQPAMIETASAPVGAGAPMDTTAPIAPAMPFGAAQAPAAEAAPSEPDPVQVASVQPAPEPADAFYVQISSQPTQALAEESMANMSRRFASQIGNRSVGIRSAEIAGKGTFYRVRVATASRNEATALCDNLKSAGGSCFVTR